jgi:hypothetical protein
MPHVEKLADLPVLLPPIYFLTSLGTIHGGMTLSAVLKLDIRRCYGSADDAALGHGHDFYWSEVRVVNIMQIDPGERRVQ